MNPCSHSSRKTDAFMTVLAQPQSCSALIWMPFDKSCEFLTDVREILTKASAGLFNVIDVCISIGLSFG